MVDDQTAALALLRLLMEEKYTRLGVGDSILLYDSHAAVWEVRTSKPGARFTALRYKGDLQGAIEKIGEIEGMNDDE